MEKTFAVEYLIDGPPIQERDISEAFSDAYGSPCCVSVREVSSTEELVQALWNILGWMESSGERENANGLFEAGMAVIKKLH